MATTSETKAAKKTAKGKRGMLCPECLSRNVGEENKGEGYCYDCGHQWPLR